ncbi:MAG: carboxyl transferase [Clostridia bacterium]|nr:carboxyl transferase [Clostridia bacterium]
MSKQKMEEWLTATASTDALSPARQLLTKLFDLGTFVETDRLLAAGVVTGYGCVDGSPVYAYAQDHNVCCGAVGKAQADKIRALYALASENGAPVVAVFDSDGAKLGEGVDAMNALSEILTATTRLSGVVPMIAVINGACVGSAAMIAAACDVVIKREDADYYLNPGDAAATADVTVEDEDALFNAVHQVLSYLPSNNLESTPIYEFDQPTALPTDTADAAAAVADADDLLELTLGGDSKAAFARIGGRAVGLLTLCGDKLGREAAKAARFVRLCDSFSLPVVTFVDAAAFGCVNCASKLATAYSEATVAKISVITGRAYGTVYVAAAGKEAGADAVLAWPNATISALAPEAAVCLFRKEELAAMTDPAKQRPQIIADYAATECSPKAAAENGWLTDVILPAETRGKVAALLGMLENKRVSTLPKKHVNIRL